MIEIEKAILSTCILFPNLLPILFDNCMKEDFRFDENKIIYGELCRLYAEKQTIDSVVMYATLKNKVQKGYISVVMESGQALPKSMSENWLLDKISVMKNHVAKLNGIKQCSEEFGSAFPDFDKIIEIAEAGKVVQINKESPGFDIAFSEYMEWKNKKKTNIVTGFPSFDKQIDGLSYGELFGIMGRTTTGKTFLSIQILNSIITKTKDKIGYFSLEMSKATFIERMMQIHFDHSRYEIWRMIKEGVLHHDEFMKKHKDLNIYSHVYSVSDISRLVERDGLRIVFIDFLQLIRKTRGNSLYENVTYQIQELKELSKNKNIVIFLLIQLSRKGEGGWVPVTIDMARDSGTIEENCDFIIGVWNHSLCQNMDEEDTEYWQGKLTLGLLKNKRGMTEKIECSFNSDTGKIKELPKRKP